MKIFFLILVSLTFSHSTNLIIIDDDFENGVSDRWIISEIEISNNIFNCANGTGCLQGCVISNAKDKGYFAIEFYLPEGGDVSFDVAIDTNDYGLYFLNDINGISSKITINPYEYYHYTANLGSSFYKKIYIKRTYGCLSIDNFQVISYTDNLTITPPTIANISSMFILLNKTSTLSFVSSTFYKTPNTAVYLNDTLYQKIAVYYYNSYYQILIKFVFNSTFIGNSSFKLTFDGLTFSNYLFISVTNGVILIEDGFENGIDTSIWEVEGVLNDTDYWIQPYEGNKSLQFSLLKYWHIPSLIYQKVKKLFFYYGGTVEFVIANNCSIYFYYDDGVNYYSKFIDINTTYFYYSFDISPLESFTINLYWKFDSAQLFGTTLCAFSIDNFKLISNQDDYYIDPPILTNISENVIFAYTEKVYVYGTGFKEFIRNCIKANNTIIQSYYLSQFKIYFEVSSLPKGNYSVYASNDGSSFSTQSMILTKVLSFPDMQKNNAEFYETNIISLSTSSYSQKSYSPSNSIKTIPGTYAIQYGLNILTLQATLPIWELTIPGVLPWYNYSLPDELIPPLTGAGEIASTGVVGLQTQDLWQSQTNKIFVRENLSNYSFLESTSYKEFVSLVNNQKRYRVEVSYQYQLGTVSLYKANLTSDFKNSLLSLPLVYDETEYFNFISYFGTHYCDKVIIGGEVKLVNEVSFCEEPTTTFKNEMSKFFEAMKTSFTEDLSTVMTNATMVKNSKISLYFKGGQPEKFICDGCSVKNFAQTVIYNPEVLELSLNEISNLIENNDLKNNMKIAVESYLKTANISTFKTYNDTNCELVLEGNSNESSDLTSGEIAAIVVSTIAGSFLMILIGVLSYNYHVKNHKKQYAEPIAAVPNDLPIVNEQNPAQNNNYNETNQA